MYFWNNPYPYTKFISDTGTNPQFSRLDHKYYPDGLTGKYYTIGDYLYTTGFSGDEYFNMLKNKGYFVKIPADCLNDDINFAEFTVVMSQGDNFGTFFGKYKTYMDIFKNENYQRMMFEMTVHDALQPIFYGWGEYEEEQPDGTTKTVSFYYEGNSYKCGCNGSERHNCADNCYDYDRHFFYQLDVTPYGLRELYKMAGFNIMTADTEQPGNQANTLWSFAKNYEFLDHSEWYDRIYSRMGGTAGHPDMDGFLGISFSSKRDHLSNAYKQTIYPVYSTTSRTVVGHHTIDDKEPKSGRSPNFYISLSKLINVDNFVNTITSPYWVKGANDWQNWDGSGWDPALLEAIPEGVIKDIITEGISHLGQPYVFGATGGTNGTGAFDCSGLVQYCFAKFGINLPRTSGAQYNATVPVSLSEARAGDLVFKQGTYKDGISHVGIYLGDGTMLEAKGAKWGIVISKIDTTSSHFAGIRRVAVN